MLLLWAIRFFVFQLYESPKYLMGRGRDEQAVDVVHKLAEYNGKTSSLTLEQLASAGALANNDTGAELDTSAAGAVKRKLRALNSQHVKSLFATKKLAYSTSILIVVWGMFSFSCWIVVLILVGSAFIGLAFPL